MWSSTGKGPLLHARDERWAWILWLSAQPFPSTLPSTDCSQTRSSLLSPLATPTRCTVTGSLFPAEDGIFVRQLWSV